MKINKSQLLFLGLFAISLGYVFLLTHGWVGLHSDSVAYLSVAENLVAGRGLKLFNLFRNETPLANFPFVYPLLLSLFRSNVFPFLYILNVICLTVSLYSIITILKKLSQQISVTTYILTIGAFLVAVPIVYVHSMALTEPLFLAVTMQILSLSLVEKISYKRLLVIFGLSALLPLIRYAGIFIFPFVGMILLLEQSPFIERTKKIALLTVSTLPFITWMLYLRSIGSSSRKLILAPATTEAFFEGLKTVYSWIIPSVGQVAYILGFVLVITLTFLAWKKKENVIHNKKLLLTLSWFLVSYYAFIMVSYLFFDRAIQSDFRRLLVPVFPVLLILFVYLVNDTLSMIKSTIFTIVIFLYIVFANFVPFTNSIKDGAPLSLYEWRNNDVISFVEQNKSNYNFVSNAWEPIYALTGVYIDRVPVKGSANSDKSQQYFTSALREDKPLVFLYAYKHNKLSYLTNTEEMKKYYNLTEIYRSEDGEAFVVTRY